MILQVEHQTSGQMVHNISPSPGFSWNSQGPISRNQNATFWGSPEAPFPSISSQQTPKYRGNWPMRGRHPIDRCCGWSWVKLRNSGCYGDMWEFMGDMSGVMKWEPFLLRGSILMQMYGIFEGFPGFDGWYIVDGSEILRSPVEVGSLSHDFLKGFSTIPGAARSLSFHQL